MDGSDVDPSSFPHRQPPRESKLAIIDASFHHQPLELVDSDDHPSTLQAWHSSHPLVSGRSSRASTDSEELESVREVLRQRRLSRHSALINLVSPDDTYAGIKAIKLAIQEHELPIKMAYKQLDELAANAERVRDSIEKNRSLLLLQYASLKFEFLPSGVLQEIMGGLCETTSQKGRGSQLVNRNSQIGFRKEKRLLKDMNLKIKERLERRAEIIMHRKRLEKLFHVLIEGCELVRMKRSYLKDLHQIMSKKKLGRIFNMWNNLRKVHSFYKRAVKKFANRRLGACFRAWKNKDFYAEFCSRKIQRKRLALIFAVWASITGRKRELKSKIQRKRLKWYFYAFRQGCQEASWSRCFQKKLARRLLSCKLKVAFQGWLNFMQVINLVHKNHLINSLAIEIAKIVTFPRVSKQLSSTVELRGKNEVFRETDVTLAQSSTERLGVNNS
ncbi:hypothetical protein L7F22_014342 [Adiantum nelumboides]|nr:hypothetical protein [Adiantum nelumboides]